MRRRAVLLIVAAVVALVLAASTGPASARELPKLIGCNSLLQWPCPGPAL